MKLIDNVTNELISAVRDTTRHMSTYPVLREEIDRVVRKSGYDVRIYFKTSLSEITR